MKKLLYAIAAVVFLSSAYSCKECGFCQYADGTQGDRVCQTRGALGATDELVEEAGQYILAESNCIRQGGSWIVVEQ